jgi:molybdopterin synthase catalytic subunit
VKHLIRKAAVHKKGTLKLMDVIQATKTNKAFQKAGAITLFIGVVRGETENKEKVEKLELEAYEEKANEALKNICNDLNKKEGIIDVQIHHLLGNFEVGEELVYVLVAGVHRSKIFPILQEAVERYKKEVPIFKKEYITSKEGKIKSYWVSERKYRANSS